MKVAEIEKQLGQFIESEDEYSLLIKGNYGCGKTYNVYNFFEKNRGVYNYIYISLFGAKTSEDIIVRLTEKLDSSFIVSINSHLFIPNLPKERKYNNGIIIFDDIERKSSNLEFSEIFNLISSLRMQGFKVIAVLCDDDIIDCEYKKFIDKTFNREIVFTGDSSSIKELLGEEINIDEDFIMTIADKNLRLVKKADNYKKDILKIFSDNKDKVSIISLNDSTILLYSIIIALRCVYWHDDKMPVFDDDKKFNLAKTHFNRDSNQFKDSLIANGLYYFFHSKKINICNISYYDVRSLILYILSNSEDYLINKEIKEEDILLQEPFCFEYFYLDDKGKINYQKAFFNNLSKFDFSKDKYIKVLLRLINSIRPFSKKEKKMIVDYVGTFKNDNISAALELLVDYQYTAETEIEKNNIAEYITLFNNIIEKNNQKYIHNIVNLNDINYKLLLEFIDKHKSNYMGCEIKFFLNEISKKSFFIPDLSKQLNEDMWQYCHRVAKLISKLGIYKTEFIDCLLNQCKKSKSLSLRERCNALAKYELGIDFDDYLDKLNHN